MELISGSVKGVLILLKGKRNPQKNADEDKERNGGVPNEGREREGWGEKNVRREKLGRVRSRNTEHYLHLHEHGALCLQRLWRKQIPTQTFMNAINIIAGVKHYYLNRWFKFGDITGETLLL